MVDSIKSKINSILSENETNLPVDVVIKDIDFKYTPYGVGGVVESHSYNLYIKYFVNFSYLDNESGSSERPLDKNSPIETFLKNDENVKFVHVPFAYGEDYLDGKGTQWEITTDAAKNLFDQFYDEISRLKDNKFTVFFSYNKTRGRIDSKEDVNRLNADFMKTANEKTSKLARKLNN